MHRITLFTTLLTLLFCTARICSGGTAAEIINTGTLTPARLDALLHTGSTIHKTGERIDFFSRQFSGVEYKASTLIGDMHTPEVFVINLAAVDCFTLIDYVQALCLSGSFNEFKTNVKRVRYKSGIVSYNTRNHFFTDWIENNAAFIADVTEQVGGHSTQSISKILNEDTPEGKMLPGIPARKREIRYIPSAALTNTLLEKVQTGDYIGIYSEDKHLDVSHAGIIIKHGKRILLRHASSHKGKVVDEDFKNYMLRRPGIVVLRTY